MGNYSSSLDAMIEKAFPPDPSSATSASRPRSGPPLGILAFEAAAAMHRALELWEALAPPRLTLLRHALQMEGIMKLVSIDKDLRWRLAGREREMDLRKLMSSAVLLGRRSSNLTLQQLETRFAEIQKPGADLSAGDLSARNLEGLLGYLRHMVTVTNNLRIELEALENMQNSSTHPLRVSKLLRQLISSAGEGAAKELSEQQARADHRAAAQASVVQKLKASSLWIEDADRAVLLLALFLLALKRRQVEAFGYPRVAPSEEAHTCGAAGLALPYSQLMLSLSKLVSRPSLLPSTRDEVYRQLPPPLQRRARLRLRGRSPSRTCAEARRAAEALAGRAVPLAQGALLWQREHAFGQPFVPRTKILQVQTLYCANKELVELTLLELLVGLSSLVRPLPPRLNPPEDSGRWTEWAAWTGLAAPRKNVTKDFQVQEGGEDSLSTRSRIDI